MRQHLIFIPTDMPEEFSVDRAYAEAVLELVNDPCRPTDFNPTALQRLI